MFSDTANIGRLLMVMEDLQMEESRQGEYALLHFGRAFVNLFSLFMTLKKLSFTVQMHASLGFDGEDYKSPLLITGTGPLSMLQDGDSSPAAGLLRTDHTIQALASCLVCIASTSSASGPSASTPQLPAF